MALDTMSTSIQIKQGSIPSKFVAHFRTAHEHYALTHFFPHLSLVLDFKWAEKVRGSS